MYKKMTPTHLFEGLCLSRAMLREWNPLPAELAPAETSRQHCSSRLKTYIREMRNQCMLTVPCIATLQAKRYAAPTRDTPCRWHAYLNSLESYTVLPSNLSTAHQ